MFSASQPAAQASIVAAVPFSIDWTTANNTVIVIDAARMVAAPVALALYVSHLHGVARELCLVIEAATSEAELEAHKAILQQIMAATQSGELAVIVASKNS